MGLEEWLLSLGGQFTFQDSRSATPKERKKRGKDDDPVPGGDSEQGCSNTSANLLGIRLFLFRGGETKNKKNNRTKCIPIALQNETSL